MAAEYHIVKSDETLGGIALKYFGDASKYKMLAAIPENKITNPNLIFPGQKIWLQDPGGSSSGSSTNSNKPEILQFGELASEPGKLFATWKWHKAGDTAKYKVLWTYDSGDGVWFSGENKEISVDKDAPELSRQSIYSVPATAKKIRFKVKPISTSKTDNGNETFLWEADWSDVKTWTDSTPLATPGSAPNVELVKYKLTASLTGIKIANATHIEFEVHKDNSNSNYARKKAKITTEQASYVFTVDAGSQYKVRCRAYNSTDKTYSDWTAYSDNYKAMPAAPVGFTVVRGNSETSVYLEWEAVNAAETYDIEYTTKKEYFDTASDTTVEQGIEFTKREITGLESGEEYFFRLRAVSEGGTSGWSEVSSVVIGEEPAAPTTWSSSTTVITGEPLKLYWVHNSKDASSQTFAEVEMTIGGIVETYTIENTTDEDEKDKTSVHEVDTTEYPEGTSILWRVRTAGITKKYGDWSIQRTVDIYAPPTLELKMTDIGGNVIETLTSFPFYIYALAGPKTQAPIGYHLAITANESYETTDSVGRAITINAGDAVYSKYFDIQDALLVEMSAGNIDLENNISYTITCEVSMNSGLTASAEVEFSVTWEELAFAPNAEIAIDYDTMTASIRPYCVDGKLVCHLVNVEGDTYTLGEEFPGGVWGEPYNGVRLETGELVYFGMTTTGEEIYYCFIETVATVEGVLMSVYRREFDGSFTELAADLDSSRATTVTDPHPALDYARYRIVAKTQATGAVTYYDLPGFYVGGKAAIIQWDEEWSNFDVTNEDEMVQPPWSGSMLKLPYNIDVTDNSAPDVSLIKYIGREHPVGYYGTHVGSTASWTVEIEKDDKDTLYALRRLMRWMGNAYVREPSGAGYWANVVVSFTQTHCEKTIPVTITINRVEGGV